MTSAALIKKKSPVPLTDGPPDDDYIVSLNIASLQHTCHTFVKRPPLILEEDAKPNEDLGGNIHIQWRLLQQHLETKGPGWYPLAEREERLFTNRSNRPGDDMKDELRTDSDPAGWRIWSTSLNQLWQLRQPAPPLEFPGEQGMLTNMYAQVREEEQVISLLVSKMYPRVGERSGSKSMMVLL